MKIKEIKIGKISVPLKRPFKTALRTVTSAEDIVIKVIDEKGNIGFGSAAPTAAITGETQTSIVSTIRDHIAPRLLGVDVEQLEGIWARIDSAVTKNSSARAAVDIAVYDLFAKNFKIPLLHHFGCLRAELTTDVTISVNSPDEMVKDALEAVRSGFTELKIKVGTDAKLDIQRVKAVREAVGRDIKIRLDANQGWKPKEAVRTIHSIEDMGLDIEFFEQPVAASDIAGLRYVTQHVESDIVADEAVFSLHDALQVLTSQAADIINIKLMKAGGIHNALKISHIAEAFGVTCMMSCMLESKVGITAAALFAASRSNITKIDLDAALLQAEDPVVGGVSFEKNAIILPRGDGLGISEVKGWQEI